MAEWPGNGLRELATMTPEGQDSDELRQLATMPPGGRGPDDLRQLATMHPGGQDPGDLRMLETIAPSDAIVEARAQATPRSDFEGLAQPSSSRSRARPTGPEADPHLEADPDTPTAARPRPGLRIHKYQLIRELGRGGMGRVYLARDTRLGRLVAIKFPEIQSQDFSRRFIAEARATARCTHENIVVVYEADEYQGQPYMVLEYVRGTTLREVLKERVTGARARGDADIGLPVERALQLVVPVLRALERAHGMGIVHRDLKPENVMLTETGGVKVLDFGIAKLLDDAEFTEDSVELITASHFDMAASRGLVGTMPYMSPEQFIGGVIDHRTDIWAVGIMLFELVAGRHPLAPLSLAKFRAIRDPHVPMPRARESCPAIGRLGPIVDRALLKSLVDRTASARAFLDDLQPLMTPGRGATLRPEDSPFSGLASFQESDASRFFGRDRDIAEVVNRVRNQPLVAVVGPSGVGKSSLIRAGVIPALKQSGEGWETAIVRPGRTPLSALAEILADHRHGRTTRTSELTLDEPSEGSDRSDLTNTSAHLLSAPGLLGAGLRDWSQRKLRRLLLFVDQIEEIYTQDVDPEERTAFLSCLAGVADDASSPLRVILAMRADFLERLSEDRAFLSAATRGLVFLAPLDRQGLHQALTRPLDAVGYSFEKPGILRDMLDALEDSHGRLPLLQFAATSLWHQRDCKRQVLTEASYRAMGGVAGSLATHADQVLAGMGARQSELARLVLTRLVTPQQTRAIVPLSELLDLPGGEPYEIEQVIYDLVDGRLVVVRDVVLSTEISDSFNWDKSGGSVELIHESLISGWPTLRGWLDDNREDLRFLSRLRAASRSWQQNDCSEGLLWRADAAHEARQWRRRYKEPLRAREQQFLDAVLALDTRLRRRKRALTYGVISSLTTALLGAALAIILILRAQAQVDEKDETIETQRAELGLKLRLEQANDELALTNDKLAQTNDKLAGALDTARRERQRAEDEAKRAEKEAERAEREQRRAEAETERAKSAAERERSARAQAEALQKDAEQAAEAERKATARAQAAELRARTAERKLQEQVERSGLGAARPQ